jgi:hypothetical protein
MKNKNEDAFYHYCSNDAFCSIIKNRKLRLSSLRLSNDKTEGTVVSKVFEALADDDPEKVDGFSEYIKEHESQYHALGFCLSEDGDLLSQWRTYADDASGVSIGFSKKYLEEFAIRYELRCSMTSGQFLKVEYDFEKQKELLRPLYGEMKDPASRGGMGLPENHSELEATSKLGILRNVSLPSELYRIKDCVFSEEKEWRVVVPLREMDLNGYGCQHRVRDRKIVPHRDFKIEASAIREVILGPKNVNSEQVVTSLLESNEIWGVTVRKSDIPYC